MGARSLGAPTLLAEAAAAAWVGTLLGMRRHLHTSDVAFLCVLEPLSNTPARLQEATPRTPDLSRGRATDGSTLTRGAHVHAC